MNVPRPYPKLGKRLRRDVRRVFLYGLLHPDAMHHAIWGVNEPVDKRRRTIEGAVRRGAKHGESAAIRAWCRLVLAGVDELPDPSNEETRG